MIEPFTKARDGPPKHFLAVDSEGNTYEETVG